MNGIMLKKIKSQYIHLIISLVCLVIVLYFGILIYKEFKPQSYDAKYMHCLELRNDLGLGLCLKQLGSKK